jgi:hypothetical protein
MLGWRLMNPYRLGHPVGEDREVGRIRSPRTGVMRRRWRGEVEEEYLDLWTSEERRYNGGRRRQWRPTAAWPSWGRNRGRMRDARSISIYSPHPPQPANANPHPALTRSVLNPLPPTQMGPRSKTRPEIPI